MCGADDRGPQDAPRPGGAAVAPGAQGPQAGAPAVQDRSDLGSTHCAGQNRSTTPSPMGVWPVQLRGADRVEVPSGCPLFWARYGPNVGFCDMLRSAIVVVGGPHTEAYWSRRECISQCRCLCHTVHEAQLRSTHCKFLQTGSSVGIRQVYSCSKVCNIWFPVFSCRCALRRHSSGILHQHSSDITTATLVHIKYI